MCNNFLQLLLLLKQLKEISNPSPKWYIHAMEKRGEMGMKFIFKGMPEAMFCSLHTYLSTIFGNMSQVNTLTNCQYWADIKIQLKIFLNLGFILFLCFLFYKMHSAVC